MFGLTCLLALVLSIAVGFLWPEATRAVIASLAETARALMGAASRVVVAHRKRVALGVRHLLGTRRRGSTGPHRDDPAVMGSIGPADTRPQDPKETVLLVEHLIGAVVFSAMALVGAGAEMALLLLTFAAMFNQPLPAFPPVYQIGTLVASGVVDVLFWGCVLVDQLGWTHLADWKLGGDRRKTRALVGVAAGMTVLLFAMFIAAAVYRDQLLAMMGMGVSTTASVATLERIAGLRLATLVMLATATFITVLVAGTFPVRLARYLVAAGLACWAALIGVVVACLAGFDSAADGAVRASNVWFETLQKERQQRRTERDHRRQHRIGRDGDSSRMAS
ncbi:MAG: hypothetical protein ACYC3F_09670 [Gemmatimonadaceae bacterium]